MLTLQRKVEMQTNNTLILHENLDYDYIRSAFYNSGYYILYVIV